MRWGCGWWLKWNAVNDVVWGWRITSAPLYVEPYAYDGVPQIIFTSLNNENEVLHHFPIKSFYIHDKRNRSHIDFKLLSFFLFVLPFYSSIFSWFVKKKKISSWHCCAYIISSLTPRGLNQSSTRLTGMAIWVFI